jgi:hypothetical protein
MQVGILVSGDNGNTWWDKTHDYPNGVPQAVVIGIPLNADYTFNITGWVSDPHDLEAGLIRVIVVPQTFSFLWPGYQVRTSTCNGFGMFRRYMLARAPPM